MSDDASRDWARSECPPTSPDVTCARLWGKSIEQITKSLSTADACGTSEADIVKAQLARAPPFRTLDKP